MKTRIIGAILALVLAVLGAFVLVNYVRGADARAADGAERAEVFIVETEIPSGTPGDRIAEYVTVDTMPVRNIAEGAVDDLAVLEGTVADAVILPGEQLLEARFVDPAVRAAQGTVDVPAGMQEVSFALPVQRMVGGSVVPGSTVGIVVTTASGVTSPAGAAPITTRFEFDRVLVTAVKVGTTVTGGSAETEGVESGDVLLFTVALGTHDVERLVWALEAAEKVPATHGVWLTLQNEATDTTGSGPVDESNVRR